MATIEETLKLILSGQAQIMTKQTELQTDVLNIKSSISTLQADFNEYKVETDGKIQAQDVRITRLETQLAKMVENEEKRIETSRKTRLRDELYSRRFNILIHGIEDQHVWEDKSVALRHVRNFLGEKLKIENAESIKIIDCHRLPQNPITENSRELRNRTVSSKKSPRPIIFKLENDFDCKKVWSSESLKNLKDENEKAAANNLSKVSISRHLPDELRKQRKELVPELIAARRNKQKASIRIDWSHIKMYLHVVNDEIPTQE